MASYLRDGDRNGLPSIRKHGFLDTQPSPRRITTLENEFIHRVGTTSPAARMMASESSILHPRPSSPNRRQMTEVSLYICTPFDYTCSMYVYVLDIINLLITSMMYIYSYVFYCPL